MVRHSCVTACYAGQSWIYNERLLYAYIRTYLFISVMPYRKDNVWNVVGACELEQYFLQPPSPVPGCEVFSPTASVHYPLTTTALTATAACVKQFEWTKVHELELDCRVRHPFPDAIYKQTPDLGREGLVSFDCWYMCGAEGWNTVHSARHRYAASSRGYLSKLLPSGNI